MPIFIPSAFGWTLGILGAAVVVRFLAKELRRVNDELNAHESLREAPARERIPVLRRDPISGIYLPE
jgi:hypothetical protein